METKPTLTTRPANLYVSEGGTYYWIYASGVINTVSVKPTSTATTTITLPSMSAKYINSNRNTAYAEVHAYLYKDYGKIGPLDGITYIKNESTISSNSEFALSSSTPTVSVNASYFEDVFSRSNKTRRFAPTMLVADHIDFLSAKMSGGHPQGEDQILLTYVEYEIVWDPEGNPSEHGWYEYDPINDEYVPTQDTEVDDTKFYYEYVDDYVWYGLADEDPGSELRFFPWPDVIDDVPCGGFWLDVPPEVTIQPLSSDTGGVFYKDVTTVSVPITNATAFYGGDFVTTKEGDAGIKLEIGSQSVSLTDIAFLTEDTTVDQSKIYYTLYTYPDGRKTYDERRSSLIRNPHEEGLYEIIDNPSGVLSIKLDTVGTFTPKITAIDSRGQKFEQTLDPITVVDYNVTTVIPSISRVNSVNEPHEDPMPGIASDEGTNAAISTTVTYIDTTQNYLLEPQVSINGEIYHPGTETPWDIDWYLDWSPDNGFTGDPINFDDYNLDNYENLDYFDGDAYGSSNDVIADQSKSYYLKTGDGRFSFYRGALQYELITEDTTGFNPKQEGWYEKIKHFEPPVSLYGWIKEEFDTDTSYNIGITGRTHWKNSAEVTTVLPQAFYLLSAAAGGHGLGIGMKVPASAERTGMHVGMDAVFYENIVFKKMAGVIQMTACPAGGPGSSTLIPANNTTVYEPIPGWLICNGAEVSRTAYSELFDVIGTSYGDGDGSDTFNIPDLRGRFPLGGGNGTADHHTSHSIGESSMGGDEDMIVPYHYHSVNAISSGAETVTLTGSAKALGWSTATASGIISITSPTNDRTASSGKNFGHRYYNIDASHAHNISAHNTNYAGTSGEEVGANMPPFIGVNFIIATGRMEDVTTQAI